MIYCANQGIAGRLIDAERKGNISLLGRSCQCQLASPESFGLASLGSERNPTESIVDNSNIRKMDLAMVRTVKFEPVLAMRAFKRKLMIFSHVRMLSNVRTDFERGAVLCAQELAGLFDRAYSLGRRVVTEISGNEVAQFSPFGPEWNSINNGLVRIAPMADKIGARKLVATDTRFWPMATYQCCVPRMKMCVDLQLSAAKVAMLGFNEEQWDFSLKVFEVVPDDFALLIGSCRDAPKLRSKHAEGASGLLKSIRSRYEERLLPLHEQALVLVPIVEAGNGLVKNRGDDDAASSG